MVTTLKCSILFFCTLLVLLAVTADRPPRYRCTHCRSRKLYRKYFAVVTKRSHKKPDHVKLNLRYYEQARCEEEGNFAHPLGDCHKYLRCHRVNQRPKIVECRPGRTFDPFTRACEDELDSRDCKSCNKPQGYKIPHEKGGAKFYMCQDGAAYEFACNNDVDFNKFTRSCGNSESNIDPRDVDDQYVPGSVAIHRGRNGKRRLATGIKFNKHVARAPRKDYHSI